MSVGAEENEEERHGEEGSGSVCVCDGVDGFGEPEGKRLMDRENNGVYCDEEVKIDVGRSGIGRGRPPDRVVNIAVDGDDLLEEGESVAPEVDWDFRVVWCSEAVALATSP